MSERSETRRIVVLCPHFDPDTAPTGVVMSRIVRELVALGDEVHVVSSLPWYRTHAIEAGWTGRLVRREVTPWGSISRVHPFPGDDKIDLPRRALGFLGYTALAGVEALRIGGPLSRVDAVIAMSPPITLGLTGWLVSRLRRGRLVFNIQDVFPDAAVETGAITNRSIVSAARALERTSYLRSDAVTVLSDDLADNVRGKLPPSAGGRVHVIPNFVDTDAIVPGDRLTPYRAELGLGDGAIVLYAGNVGFSQSLDLMLAAAREIPEATFLVNGDGAARPELERAAAGLANVRFAGYLDAARLSELLATGDIHVVALKRGLARVSVPSKTYSIMAAARPVLASIDPGTAVPKILEQSGGGVTVAPDEPVAFVRALRGLLDDPAAAEAIGRRGRAWVEREASPAAVGAAYHQLIDSLTR
ncbi:MAG: glycosyltransferase family 4 protein [Ilumatobacteraceae bacterium]